MGTLVIITGTGLQGGGSAINAVTLAGNPANITKANDTVIHCTALAASAGTGAVMVVADSGAITSGLVWTYLNPSEITSVSPAEGQAKTLIILTGSRLLGGGTMVVSVTLAGVVATITMGNSNTLIKVEAGARATSGAGLIIVQADTGALTIASSNFTYLTASVITAITPAAGQLGNRVTITGQNLWAGGTQISTVTLGGKVANIENQTNEVVVVIVGTCGSSCAGRDVVVVSDTGSQTVLTDGWKYSQIVSISPSTGQRGTLVTLSGIGLFIDGTAVKNVKLAAIDVEKIVSANESYVIVQAGESAASVPSAVTIFANTGAAIDKAFFFKYLDPSIITAVSPTSGQLGTRVTILGNRFYGGGTRITLVQLGDTVATILSANDTTIVVRAVSSVAASSVITIVSDTNARTVGGSWQQLTDAVITNATTSGQLGTLVEIVGLRLFCGAAGSNPITVVTLVNVSAEIISQSDTTVVVRAQESTPGQGDILLTTSTGAYVLLPNGYAYKTKGVIATVQPAAGQYGTVIVLTGTNLRGGSSAVAKVLIGGLAMTLLQENNTRVVIQLTNATTTALAMVGKATVVLFADSGATITLVDGFTFLPTGVLATVQPAFGQVGTRVVLRGTNLLGGGSVITMVTLNDAAALITFFNNTEIHLVASAGAEGLGDVVIVSDTSAMVIKAASFRYGPLGVVTSLFPARGRSGTYVVICGNDLLEGGTQYSTVMFGNRSTTIVAYNSTCVQVRVNVV